MVSQKCLTADTIKSLTNSEIPPSVEKKTCYWVQMISSDSTDISKAVESFIRANDEFDNKIKNMAVPKRARGESPNGSRSANLAAQIIAAAALEDDVDKLVAKASNLSEDDRAAAKKELALMRTGITDEDLLQKIDAVIAAL